MRSTIDRGTRRVGISAAAFAVGAALAACSPMGGTGSGAAMDERSRLLDDASASTPSGGSTSVDRVPGSTSSATTGATGAAGSSTGASPATAAPSATTAAGSTATATTAADPVRPDSRGPGGPTGTAETSASTTPTPPRTGDGRARIGDPCPGRHGSQRPAVNGQTLICAGEHLPRWTVILDDPDGPATSSPAPAEPGDAGGTNGTTAPAPSDPAQGDPAAAGGPAPTGT